MHLKRFCNNFRFEMRRCSVKRKRLFSICNPFSYLPFHWRIGKRLNNSSLDCSKLCSLWKSYQKSPGLKNIRKLFEGFLYMTYVMNVNVLEKISNGPVNETFSGVQRFNIIFSLFTNKVLGNKFMESVKQISKEAWNYIPWQRDAHFYEAVVINFWFFEGSRQAEV